MRGFGSWNLDKDNNNLSSDLYKSYHEEFQMVPAINTYKVSFFEQISYFIINNNDNSSERNESMSHVKIKVGDVVDLKEISVPDDDSFAIVRAIITHKANNGRVYAFFIFRWLEDLKKITQRLNVHNFDFNIILIFNGDVFLLFR